MKKWGKVKIAYHLKQHNLDETIIQDALESLDQTEYRDTIENLIITKSKTVSAKNSYQKKHKIAQFMIAKGFEPDITWEIIEKLKLE
jgi:regulatory protein